MFIGQLAVALFLFISGLEFTSSIDGTHLYIGQPIVTEYTFNKYTASNRLDVLDWITFVQSDIQQIQSCKLGFTHTFKYFLDHENVQETVLSKTAFQRKFSS